MGAIGLSTHIWSNNLKSVLLLCGFPVLLLILLFALCVGYVGLAGMAEEPVAGLQLAAEMMRGSWPFALLGAGIWFAIAWFAHTAMINQAVGARSLKRDEAPELYNMLENMCIARGLKMPILQIIESNALNAFASGIHEDNYRISVTRGLVNALDKEELEAVLAHELTHIINRDVRLLIIAVIFVGIFSFLGELLYNGLLRTGIRVGGHTRSRQGDSRGGGILIIIAVLAIIIAYLLAILIRFSLSRKREYLADAGAVELTKNPDAMISALQKISGRSHLDAPADVQQMMIDNDRPFAGIFMTHPSIDRRIEALTLYAGARV